MAARLCRSRQVSPSHGTKTEMSDRPSKRQIPGRLVVQDASAEAGREVLRMDAIPVNPGDALTFRFDRVNSPRRQGIWLGTMGILKIESETSPQFQLWHDTAPPEVRVEVLKSDGTLRFNNCYMRPDGSGPRTPATTSACHRCMTSPSSR
jgi:hypothetical protein